MNVNLADAVNVIKAGALIFFAGALTQQVRDHDRRINKLEDAFERELERTQKRERA